MLQANQIDPIVKLALREDVGSKDITTSCIIPPNMRIKADIEFKQPGVLCGLEIAERVFRLIDENLRFLPVARDGERIEKNREVAYIEGSAASVLIAERTALNFLGHLSGIATRTREFVDKVKNTRANILDTRKTTPGLRLFEKYAVATGGAMNHRMGLYDQALIKDNHLRILRKQSITSTVSGLKNGILRRTIAGIEVKNLSELKEAFKTSVDYILLDNMKVETVREAVNMRKRLGSRIYFEASGGITIDNVLEYAQTGVERISVGALTHNAPSIDVSLDIVA